MCRFATPLLLLYGCLLLLDSCSPSDGNFRLEGQFKNMNQGAFYIIDHEHGHKDTIRVNDGRFTYVLPLRDTLTLTMLFPNFSEIPVFAQPGAQVTMKGDVSHLKETEVKGTADNDAMTAFRLNVAQLTPPEAERQAEQYIGEHASSPVSLYLLQRYFLSRHHTDYAKATKLCRLMADVCGDRKSGSYMAVKVGALLDQLQSVKNHREKGTLPAFKATDTEGRTVTQADMKRKVNR